MISVAKAVCVSMCFAAAAVYRFQQVSDILYRRHKQQQQQGGEDREEDEAQSLDMWLLTDSTLAQLMDPQLAAPAVQFLVLEVALSPGHVCQSVHVSLSLTMSLHHTAAFGQNCRGCESAVALCLHTVPPAAAAASLLKIHVGTGMPSRTQPFYNAYPSVSPSWLRPSLETFPMLAGNMAAEASQAGSRDRQKSLCQDS